jgi:cytochrome b6-f complex iron-sulfur subunit
VPTNNRFECPCHGSKYLKSGARIDGPARRNLDMFFIEVLDANGNVLSRSEPTLGSQEAASVKVPAGAAALRIDTGRRVVGAVNSKPGGGI